MTPRQEHAAQKPNLEYRNSKSLVASISFIESEVLTPQLLHKSNMHVTCDVCDLSTLK